MIYLASPYSGTADERAERYTLAVEFCTRYLTQGIVLFSPIVYGHPFAQTVGTSAAAWTPFNQQMIDLASEMWVLTLPGWKTSKGVQQEIATWEFLKARRPIMKSF